mgnify:CR=1 FL=1
MGSKLRGMRRNLTNYGDPEFSLYLRTAFIKAMGYTDDALDRPIGGIVDTGSGYNPCHATVPELIKSIGRGVMMAGGLPIEFPTISLHESFAYPTSMFLRNLMAMDTEEMIRAQPMDAVVLIGGCDKTVPAQLMAAASADIPAISVVTGPMLSGAHRGERVGACTDCRRFWARYRAGEIDRPEIDEITDNLVPSGGTCGVMGTASTMACMTEALGMMLLGGSTIPAVLADRMRHAELAGKRAVALAAEGLTPSRIITPAALANALRMLLAIGGSTNAIVHLAAIAGRLGIAIDYQAFDEMGRETPVLLDLKPSGDYYMDDLHRAGGMVPIFKELKALLNLDCLTVSGRTLGEEIDDLPPPFKQEVVRPFDHPIHQGGSIAVLNGNLAGNGAIIKQSAGTPHLMVHTGKAVVFESIEDMTARIDDPDLDVSESDVLVMKNCGPRGAPGMPEAGYIPIPKKLAQNGVNDMVRISDGRMSGTAFGTIILHASPESAIGGPLALVENGDAITLDVPSRLLTLHVDDSELERRRASLKPPVDPATLRGYLRLYHEQVNQAEKGCDFSFMTAQEMVAKTP